MKKIVIALLLFIAAVCGFEIDSQGTVTIRKFSHSVKRTIDNKVWLDGVRVN